MKSLRVQVEERVSKASRTFPCDASPNKCAAALLDHYEDILPFMNAKKQSYLCYLSQSTQVLYLVLIFGAVLKVL